MDLFTLAGLVLVCGALGGIAKVLHDISLTLRRMEDRMAGIEVDPVDPIESPEIL